MISSKQESKTGSRAAFEVSVNAITDRVWEKITPQPNHFRLTSSILNQEFPECVAREPTQSNAVINNLFKLSGAEKDQGFLEVKAIALAKERVQHRPADLFKPLELCKGEVACEVPDIEQQRLADRLKHHKGFTVFKFDVETGLQSIKMSPRDPTLWDRQRANATIQDINDKVAQRVIAGKIGIFGQPAYLDASSFSPPPKLALIRNIKLVGQGIEEQAAKKGFCVVHHQDHGFAVLKGASGYEIYSKNPAVVATIEQVDKITPGKKHDAVWFSRFLSKLESNPDFKIVMGEDRQREDTSKRHEKLIDALMKHEGVLYIKSSRTAGGVGVLRFSRDASGDVTIDSDSIEMMKAIWPKIANYVRARERVKILKAPSDGASGAQESTTQSDLAVALSEETAARFKPTPRHFLSILLHVMSHVIIEENLPRETRKRGKGEDLVEIRVLCQLEVKGAEFTKRWSIGDYSKVSENRVAANVALGGWGEKTEKVFKDIYEQRGFGSDSQKLANESRAELRMRCEKFANAYRNAMLDKGLLPTSMSCCDFGIDVIPYWDEKRSRLDFNFLEVQTPYGFEGYKECDPLGAGKVEMLKHDHNSLRFFVRPQIESPMAIGADPYGDRGLALLLQGLADAPADQKHAVEDADRPSLQTSSFSPRKVV